ncbi:hypothetical protein D9M72_534430 [compost metagenome]
MHAREIVRVDRGGKAERRVVRQRNRVLQRVEGAGDQHGPKNLFAHDAHLRLAIGKDRRFDEMARSVGTAAAMDQLRAFAAAGLDIAGNDLLLLRRDHGADVAIAVEAWRELQRAGDSDQLFEEGVMDRSLDIDAGAGIADLAGIEEHAVCHCAGSTCQIGIIEHQHR